MERVLEYLSPSIRYEIQRYLQRTSEDIEEIRLRINKPIVLKTASNNEILEHIVTTEELLQTFQKVCEHSIYSYQKQICEGFITIKGGHRVGITGSCVIENGKIININYISSLNFRIAREKKDVSNNVIQYILSNNNLHENTEIIKKFGTVEKKIKDENEKDKITNTLIVSKPGCGKTTLLRDLIRKISTGIPEYSLKAKTCGVVDERGEIAAMYKGVPQNDLGILSDVIENCTKSQGMKMLIRSMSPEIIACDEIGSKEDIEAINYAMCCGVKGLFTAHGNSLEEILLNNEIKDLLEKHIIETIIFLDDKTKGKVTEVYKLDKEKKVYIKTI